MDPDARVARIRSRISSARFTKIPSTAGPRKSLKSRVPEEGIEPSWTQGLRDFEFGGGGGQEDTAGHNCPLLTHFGAVRILRSVLLYPPVVYSSITFRSQSGLYRVGKQRFMTGASLSTPALGWSTLDAGSTPAPGSKDL